MNQVPEGSTLAHAQRLQDAAAAQGFDWPDMTGVWAKLREECDELAAAQTPDHQAEELGDLLFMLVNVARHLDLSPDRALEAACRKFERRFAAVRQGMQAEGLPMEAAQLAAMERHWVQAKADEKSAQS